MLKKNNNDITYPKRKKNNNDIDALASKPKAKKANNL
jgi:hypothetical protein